MTSVAQGQAQGGGGSSVLVNPIGFATYAPSASITMNSIGGSVPHNNMSPFVLGSWYVKL